MSTDNAYVQADMVGLSTGTYPESSARSRFTIIKKVAKGDVLFQARRSASFGWRWDRAEAQIGNTRNDLVALQTSYRNMQAPGRNRRQEGC